MSLVYQVETPSFDILDFTFVFYIHLSDFTAACITRDMDVPGCPTPGPLRCETACSHRHGRYFPDAALTLTFTAHRPRKNVLERASVVSPSSRR